MDEREMMEEKIRKKALDMLAHKDYSKNELVKRLSKYTDDDVAEIIADRFSEAGILNDESYAYRLCSALLFEKDYGERKVLYEMKNCGITDEMANDVLRRLAPNAREQIMHYLNKKFRRAPFDEKQKKKAFSALVRHGFNNDDIKYTILMFEDLQSNK